MLDVSVSYNRYKFLGYEFLTWLWFSIEKNSEGLSRALHNEGMLQIGNRIKLENRKNQCVETITIKGDEAGLEEGMLALQKGALVTELNLIYEKDSQFWQFTIKGESLSVGSVKTPATAPIEEKTDMEGKILEKTYLYGEAMGLIDRLFKTFITARISSGWTGETVPKINGWMNASGG